MTLVDIDFSALPFRDVVPIWIELRKQREGLKALTHDCTRSYLSVLSKFFGPIPLNKISAGHLREYQLARQRNVIRIEDPASPQGYREESPWRKPAGASLINHELVALKQILRHARLWAPLHPYYYPLPVPTWRPPTIPDEDEEQKLFEAVKKNPEVALATWVATITNNTSAAGCELRGLKLKHLILREPTIRNGVDVTPSEVYIPREATKNDDRPRRIPLNTSAKLAFMQVLGRAHRLGSTDPEHYLFPFREKRNKYDPTRPASRWHLRNNWNKLRETAQLPSVRPHDMRHLAITRMLENPQINPETVQAVAGHVGRKMMEHYSHIRMRAKLDAVTAIESGRKKAGER